MWDTGPQPPAAPGGRCHHDGATMTGNTFAMIRLFVAALFLVLTLAACQSAEERAEEHYQSALALLAEGDLARATVEFRNVFELDGLHVAARRTFAQALREDGDIAQSYSQFLRLAEQLPDDVESRIALAELAMDTQNWEQLNVHGSRILALVPEENRNDPRITVIAVVLAYAQALEAENETARRDAADATRAALDVAPENLSLYRVLVDSAIRDNDQPLALEITETALGFAPDNRDLHNTRLGLLAQAEDAPGVETQLEEMITRFPGDNELIGTLLRFYISQNDTESAEAFLRDRITQEEDPERAASLRAALVQFLMQSDGPETALAEIDGLITAFPDDLRYRTMRASLRFAMGATDEAIAEMEAVVEGTGVSSTANDSRIALAQMYAQVGNPVGARRLVGEVLEGDDTHIAALGLEAGWLIEDDRADDAIALLRRSLDEAPDNADAMTLMARAHARNGNHELARDFLALAFEASGAAPAEAIRYAQDLADGELYLAAEETLITALRLQPGNLQLLDRLGQVYIAMEDWSRAEGVEDSARRLGTEEGEALAAGLRVARLGARGQTEDALGFLQDLAATGEGQTGLAAQLAVVGTFLSNGQSAEALAFLDEALTEAPGNIGLLMARGAAERSAGDIPAAIATYGTVLEAEPAFERAWLELIRTESLAGDADAARATLERALAELPNGVELLWAQASFLEQSGDIEGAIAIYESLYDELPNSPVVANNLASLISTYRDDDASLERAYAIARRLRGTDVPALMDTYGWITFRRGDIAEARPYLESAATALADDPLVQFHYGMLLSAAEETEAAIAQLTRALEIAGPDDERPQFVTARAELERLQTGAETEGQ